MKTNQNADYYLQRLVKYWKQFGRIFRSSEKILPKYLETPSVAAVLEDTKNEFAAVLTELPYIGGDKNMFTFPFVSSAVALAFIRMLEKRGLTEDRIGRILNEIYDDVFRSLPGVAKMFLKWSEFSYFRQRKLKAFAEVSQAREYSDNFVMEYVEGDGKNFDFGCNYTECAILKFYRRMGYEEYVPYLCATDMTYSRALRLGLKRSTTQYYGSNSCDFRYKKNE